MISPTRFSGAPGTYTLQKSTVLIGLTNPNSTRNQSRGANWFLYTKYFQVMSFSSSTIMVKLSFCSNGAQVRPICMLQKVDIFAYIWSYLHMPSLEKILLDRKKQFLNDNCFVGGQNKISRPYHAAKLCFRCVLVCAAPTHMERKSLLLIQTSRIFHNERYWW